MRWIVVVLCVAFLAAGMLHGGGAQAFGHTHASTALSAGVDLNSVPCEEGIDHGFGETCSVTAGCAFCIPVPQGFAFLAPTTAKLHAAAAALRQGTGGAPQIRPPRLSLQV